MHTKKRTNRGNVIGLKKSINILVSMVNKNTKSQYRNSVLGILWTILNPLLNMLVIVLVFTNIFGRNMQSGMDYSIYVLSGNIVFNLMRMATQNSLSCIVSNYDLMTKTRVPYYVFPLSNVLSSIMNFMFSLAALFAVMLFRMSNGIQFHWTIFLMPITFLPALFLFSLGISFILCTMYVYFRDTQHIYSVFLTLWMYCTPIFYDANILSAKVKMLINLNPMYHFVNNFRDITILGNIPNITDYIVIYGFGLIFFFIGLAVFASKRKKFIFYI